MRKLLIALTLLIGCDSTKKVDESVQRALDERDQQRVEAASKEGSSHKLGDITLPPFRWFDGDSSHPFSPVPYRGIMSKGECVLSGGFLDCTGAGGGGTLTAAHFTNQASPVDALDLLGGGILLAPLATPGTVTIVITGGAAGTQTYKCVAFDAAGNATLPSATGSTAGAGPTTLDASHYNTLTCPAVTGAVKYLFYRVSGGASQGRITPAIGQAANTLRDNGIVAAAYTLPTRNATGDVLVGGELSVGNEGLVFTTDPTMRIFRNGASDLRLTNGTLNAQAEVRMTSGTGTVLGYNGSYLIFDGTSVYGNDGSKSRPFWSFSNELGMGWYRAGAGDMRAAVAGADLIKVGPNTGVQLLDGAGTGLLLIDDVNGIYESWSGNILNITGGGTSITGPLSVAGAVSVSSAFATGATPTPKLTLSTTSAAANGAQQWSPAFDFIGNKWDSGAGASQAHRIRLVQRTIQTAGAGRGGDLVIYSEDNGGGAVEVGSIQPRDDTPAMSIVGGNTGTSFLKMGDGTGDVLQWGDQALTITGSAVNFIVATATIAQAVATGLVVASGKKMTAPRYYNSGTALTAGNIAPGAGFGAGASASAVLGHDGMGEFKITASGLGLASNATVVVTFADGTWTTTPLCHAWMEAATGVTAVLNTTLTDQETATTYTITYNGTALTAGDTITIAFLCQGT